MAHRTASDLRTRIPDGGRRRVLVEDPSPNVDGGRYPAKHVLGDRVDAECDLVADGHDAIAGRVLYRRAGADMWQSAPLAPLGNDRFRGSFVVDALGVWELVFEGWIDAFTTWHRGTAKKRAAGQSIGVELLVGAKLLSEGAARARTRDPAVVERLAEAARIVADTRRDPNERFEASIAPDVVAAMREAPDLEHATRSERPLSIVVDPELARFSAWYELFPRSAGDGIRHGTFADVERRLDYVAAMGFDILYLPPIHPIGRAFRKGPNNTLVAGPRDPGSPWAIGGEAGGHHSVHPELGTEADLRSLVRSARQKGLEIALDIAFQASPDHPYLKQHPEWFVRRPDGSIQHAENPPKKYEDVVPFDFECEAWRSLWAELLSVVLHWCDVGVRVFRVDNPHTKALRFWEWCIGEVKARHPETIFLAEAFTRPKPMYALAKAGFTQSYTYFTWRETKQDLTRYLAELVRPEVRAFYRPCFWPNTPDILPEHLQHGGRPMFLARMVLAATLSSNWGIYGPAFELMEHVPRAGTEEYVDNEKYQLRAWRWDDPSSLRDAIAVVNRARRENLALQRTERITFHDASDDAILVYSKRTEDFGNVVLVAVNLDPKNRRGAFVDLDLRELGLEAGQSFQVHDLLGQTRHIWNAGTRPWLELDPTLVPASLFVVRRRVRSEHDFEYFL